jgi:hypothetical protein
VRTFAGLCLLIVAAADAQAQSKELLRFISCPIYRDTDAGRKSGCWLVDDPATGKRWDVTQSPYKPDWQLAVLVEGRVSDAKPNLCGSPVLDPVRTSRLDRPCVRHVLPPEGYPGRKFTLPPRNIAPLSVARKAPDGPFDDRTFTVYFEFDNDFLVYQYDDYLIDKAVTWIRAAKPRRLVVTGYAATDPVAVSGVTLAERSEVASERAEAIAETLRRLVPGTAITIETRLSAQPTDDPDADTIPGQSQRRVEIRAHF